MRCCMDKERYSIILYLRYRGAEHPADVGSAPVAAEKRGDMKCAVIRGYHG